MQMLGNDDAEYISWAAYHASLIELTGYKGVSLTSLLPLFHSVAILWML